MPYIKQSVKRAPGNPGIGIHTRDALTLIDVEDVQFFPSRDDKGVVIADDIILKKGCYGYTIYMTPGTVEVTSAADGDTDQVGFTPQVKFNHPGNEQPVREFKANSLNRKFIIIVRYCRDKATDVIGDLCNPCKMTPSYTGNKDGNTNEFTFQQIDKGDDIGIYLGTVPEEEPVAVLSADDTDLDFVGDGQYLIKGGTNASDLTTINGGSEGAVITLVGNAPFDGNDRPTDSKVRKVTSTTDGNILLKKGEAFVAIDGSQLTLRWFAKSTDSGIWIEQSRYVAG